MLEKNQSSELEFITQEQKKNRPDMEKIIIKTKKHNGRELH